MKKKSPAKQGSPLWRGLRSGLLRCAKTLFFLCFIATYAVILFRFIDPSGGFYMGAEARRLGHIEANWVNMENIAPVMARSAVAAEDANYCLHFGFDVSAIKQAINEGRGGSGISQQVAKNLFLWHQRSYLRKGLEAGFTVLIETLWTKRRILEVYLNIAEFDEGVFGVGAAAQHYFGVDADRLTPLQAARLAAILPNPKARSASAPSTYVRKRTGAIRSGAATIAADGRAECFESG